MKGIKDACNDESEGGNMPATEEVYRRPRIKCLGRFQKTY